jgi:hypothetical protein
MERFRYAQVIRLERKISLVFGREKTEEPIHKKTTTVNSYMYSSTVTCIYDEGDQS